MTSGEEVQGGDGGRENEREVRKKVREGERERGGGGEREREATFFNHLTYLIAMNNKCVGLQLGRGGGGGTEATAECVCVCVHTLWLCCMEGG